PLRSRLSPSVTVLRYSSTTKTDNNEAKTDLNDDKTESFGSGSENKSLLDNLSVLGVDVQMAQRRQPGVFRRIHTNEQGLINFLEQKGASRDIIASIISRFPRAITRSEDHLEERWRLWRSIFNSDDEVVMILNRSPESFFRSSDNGNLEKNIHYLSSLGIKPKDLHRLLTMAPRIFSNTLALNRTMVELLENVCMSLGGTDSKKFARTVISRNVYILIRSTKRVNSNIEFLLRSLELSDEEALKLFQGHGAKILDLSHENMKTNFRNLQLKLKSLRCSQGQVREIILNYAPILFFSSDTLNQKLDCLTEGGINIRSIIEKPKLLDYSVTTLKQRLNDLQQLGYDFKVNGISVLDLSNKRFKSKLEKLRELGVMEGGDVNSTESGTLQATDRGEAALKIQYVTNKEKFYEFLAAGLKSEKAEDEKISGEAPVDGAEEPSREPETKKRKLDGNEQTQEKKKRRGQNKSRPHLKPHSYEERRLCPSVIQESERKCFYGEKCKFIHDVADYMSTKPADLGDSCYLYDTFGRCPYGVACRFAKAHTGPDYKNLVNEELCKSLARAKTVRNNLDKDLQKRLRKRQVSFKRSDNFLKIISAGKNQNKKLTGSENTPVEAGQEEEGRQSADKQEDPAAELKAEESSMKPPPVKTIGPLTDDDLIKLRPCEKKQVDFREKLYLAPLTTCGNLPFRRLCKRFGADITCGEMAMCTNLLQGQTSEWALLKRHHTEDIFGVQLEGCFPDTMTRCAELLNHNIDVDFVDINSGCPIDLVYKKGGGCGLMARTNKFEQIIRGMNSVLDVPLTVKIRTGVQQSCNIAHKLIPELKKWGVSMITLHGRSREQRYTKLADWRYIDTCSKLAAPVPLFGNGDILTYEDAMRARETGVSGIMVARGALIKPWLFTEIKEQRHWDISSSERFQILQDFTHFGLEHWGSDTQGVEKTRNFLLEWLSFTCRYIPVGLLERVQKINERPPYYLGRDYLETLMASQHVDDWIRISEMLLGPVPKNFSFLPKHKANSYK
ncbi:hypothetical protein QTP86_021657, partial [Hemibagrus guttatus]